MLDDPIQSKSKHLNDGDYKHLYFIDSTNKFKASYHYS